MSSKKAKWFRSIIFCLMIMMGLPLFAQYPVIIDMCHTMIGDATVVARQSVVHHPGFKVKAGLYYHAYIDSTFTGSGTPYELPDEPSNQVISASNLNYIITTTPQISGFDPGQNHLNDEVDVNIMYYDGLGRELQLVAVMASPYQKDMVMPISYDDMGRRNREFIPYESSQQSGSYCSDWLTSQQAFIESAFGTIEKMYGFSEIEYEPTPLNRIVKKSAPGSDWALKKENPDQEHVISFDYTTNEQINSWECINNSFVPVTYQSGQLYVNITQNENNQINQTISREFKDKSGKVVMMETMLSGIALRTRYVYDDFGLLRCVVPPKATEPSDPLLCFQYTYDSRNRLIEKKLPGSGWQYMIYDKRDRLVMTQDANMRNENPQKWILFSYDEYNRPVMSSMYIHNTVLTRNEMQARYDTLVNKLSECRDGLAQDSSHGYTHSVAHDLGGVSTSNDVLTITYYDDYSFDNGGYGFDSGNNIVPVSKVISMAKNHITGSKMRVLNSESEILISA